MLKMKKFLPIETINPVDLVNRASILDAKLLYTNMSDEEIEKAEKELREINNQLKPVMA